MALNLIQMALKWLFPKNHKNRPGGWGLRVKTEIAHSLWRMGTPLQDPGLS